MAVSSLVMDGVVLVKSMVLASKFRGCLIGSLLGDCLGSPYENEEVSKVTLQKYFDKLDGPYFKVPFKQYTDDTAMSKSVAESLIHRNGFDGHDLATRFVKEYFTEPKRGYGQNVVEVFFKLRAQKMKDPFGPAREQFEGTGSYGNGGAMRIAPVALFCHHSYDQLIDTVKQVTSITHTHKQGIDGAILQALAVQQSLHLDPKKPVDVKEFTSNLRRSMKAIEKDEEGLGLEEVTPFQRQLGLMEKLLDEAGGARDDQVQKILGTNVSALHSVPTAIYCFLRAQQDIPGIETDNPFRRTIQYAISLGGDTDTIASMAGAIAGSFYGDQVINKSLQQHCEDAEEMSRMADTLLEVSALRI